LPFHNSKNRSVDINLKGMPNANSSKITADTITGRNHITHTQHIKSYITIKQQVKSFF